ncbi:hypothetical protein RJ641_004920, partial [Dillenia turbinata]
MEPDHVTFVGVLSACTHAGVREHQSQRNCMNLGFSGVCNVGCFSEDELIYVCASAEKTNSLIEYLDGKLLSTISMQKQELLSSESDAQQSPFSPLNDVVFLSTDTCKVTCQSKSLVRANPDHPTGILPIFMACLLGPVPNPKSREVNSITFIL